MYFRSKKKQTKEVSFYEPIGTDKEGNEINLLDVIESQEQSAFEIVSAKDDTKKVYELIPMVLTEREREVLALRYGLYGKKEYTQREVAEKLGISRSYISRIEKTAIEKLRSCFYKKNLLQSKYPKSSTDKSIRQFHKKIKLKRGKKDV